MKYNDGTLGREPRWVHIRGPGMTFHDFLIYASLVGSVVLLKKLQ